MELPFQVRTVPSGLLRVPTAPGPTVIAVAFWIWWEAALMIPLLVMEPKVPEPVVPTEPKVPAPAVVTEPKVPVAPAVMVPAVVMEPKVPVAPAVMAPVIPMLPPLIVPIVAVVDATSDALVIPLLLKSTDWSAGYRLQSAISCN